MKTSKYSSWVVHGAKSAVNVCLIQWWLLLNILPLAASTAVTTMYVVSCHCLSVCVTLGASWSTATRSIWKMLGPFATASRRTPPVLILHCHSPCVATVARRLRYSNVKSMSTTTTTTTTRDRGDRYGPIEWAQSPVDVSPCNATFSGVEDLSQISIGSPSPGCL